MAEERIWDVVLDRISSMDGKIDELVRVVAAGQERSEEVARRLGEHDKDIKTLDTTVNAHGTALNHHGRVVGILGWAMAIMGGVVLVALATELIKILAAGIK